jgi:gluconate kinase
MIWLLFGEMGVGKNHVGERLAKHLGCPFFDGDDAIPNWMWEKIRQFAPLTIKDLDIYVGWYLSPAIYTRHRFGNDLVVAQALYRDRHRQMVVDSRGMFGKAIRNAVTPVWITTPPFPVHAKRLPGRENGLKWLAYAFLCQSFFEKPDPKVARIENWGSDDLAQQFRRLTGR